MSILDVCFLSETKTFEQFSDFLAFTLSYKNSHQLGLNQPTDMFDHSKNPEGEGKKIEHGTGGLGRLWRPKKRQNILVPISVATVVDLLVHPIFTFQSSFNTSRNCKLSKPRTTYTFILLCRLTQYQNF